MRWARASRGTAAAACWTSALLALALVSGCSGADGTSATGSSVTVPAGTQPSTGTPEPTTSAAPSPTTSPTQTPSPTATRWPKALGEPQEGESAWAVYLAVAHSSSDPAMQAAQDEVAKVGYGAGPRAG